MYISGLFRRRKGGDIMVTRKDLVIAVLSTFCLVSTLFMIVPTRSQTTHPYDPWIDTDDDGDIDLYDAVELLTMYGSKGTPINKTQLLLELQARLDALNATVLTLEEQIALLGGGACAVEVGKFDGEVNSDMVEKEAATVINFENPFTSIDPPNMFVIIVLKQAANGLVEGAAIKAVESIKGSAGNWTGFDLTVSKYSDGSSISDTVKVFVTWMAVETVGTTMQPGHCANTQQLMTSGNQITITFPVGMFTTAPNLSVTVFILTGTHVGRICYISSKSVSATSATLSLEAWDGGSWQHIEDSEFAQVSWVAVENNT